MKQTFFYQINYEMSISQIRAVMRKRIDQIDERFLRVMFAMTETYLKELEDAELEAKMNSVPLPEGWKPMTEAELLERLEASSAEIARGEYVSLEDLKKESEQW